MDLKFGPTIRDASSGSLQVDRGEINTECVTRTRCAIPRVMV